MEERELGISLLMKEAGRRGWSICVVAALVERKVRRVCSRQRRRMCVCVCVCVFVCVCVCLMCVFVQWVMIFDLAISPSVFKMHRTGQRERLT